MNSHKLFVEFQIINGVLVLVGGGLMYFIMHTPLYSVIFMAIPVVFIGIGLAGITHSIYVMSYYRDENVHPNFILKEEKRLTLRRSPKSHGLFESYCAGRGEYFLTEQGGLLAFGAQTAFTRGLFAVYHLAVFCLATGYDLTIEERIY